MSCHFPPACSVQIFSGERCVQGEVGGGGIEQRDKEGRVEGGIMEKGGEGVGSKGDGATFRIGVATASLKSPTNDRGGLLRRGDCDFVWVLKGGRRSD